MSEPLIGMAHIRTAKGPIEYRDERAPEWLQVIWAANELEPGFFGRPELGPWWAGGSVEEYPDARVIHRDDPSVSIVAKTKHGDDVLRQAAEKLGIHVAESVSVITLKEGNYDT